tara:strand:+ start:618 stop:923 length:306 start_codon:yes stop_codon:yes gene_type:complete
MSELEEKLGPGYQQIIIGLLLFIAGALWGGMAAVDGMKAEDVYWPSVVMLSGAMITLLGTTFGTDKEDDRSTDLNDAIAELTGMLNTLQDKVSGNESAEEE